MKAIPPRWAQFSLTFLFFFGAAISSPAQVVISEFLTNNQYQPPLNPPNPPLGLRDDEGEASDWIELHNTGPTEVSLNGWYLTDNADDLRAWQFPVTTPAVTLVPGARLIVFASRKDRKAAANRLHTNFRLESSGGYLALVRPDGLTVEHAYPSYPQQVQDVTYGLPTAPWQAVVPDPTSGKAKVPLSPADMGTGWNTAPTYDDSAWQAGVTGFGYDTGGTFGTLIGAGGDLQTAMHNVNATALIRIAFNVANPAAITALRLQMKFDDGFIAYLNGVEIAQTNAPAPAAWDSSALADRAEGLTSNFEVFNSATAHTALVQGANVLAIQLLNFTNGSTQDTDPQGTPNGSRALALPLLEATFSELPNYLTTPTPHLANTAARTSLGPLLSDTTKSPARPLGDSTSPPITVVSKVVPSLQPVSSVELKYRAMYTPETTVAMVDDGTNGDVTANDTIYTGQIPTATLLPGQMLRWRVVATDTSGVTSTDPPYRDIADNDQYFGTIALETATSTSQLPVLHWFVQNPAASQSISGTRCSIFFLGRFYDNVDVNRHGQSSGDFPVQKKSHDFNFSQDNRFTWKEGEKPQRAMNLLTTWADKARFRDTLAWESWANAQHIASHWAQLVRVQQNANFWGIYDMVENGDEDFLERAGLDPGGALYKMYNRLDSAAVGTGVEKKSREFELPVANAHVDLKALVDRLNTNLAGKRLYAYDNVDVPSLVNFLATNAVIINNDSGHKNYYLYRDSDGTGEWSVLPWDQDLSIGHSWTTSQTYFNDDIHTQAGLILGAQAENRLMNLVTSSGNVAPEMVQMFMRRLRTLMDSLLMAPGTIDGRMERRINELVDLMDPPDATFLTDADLDLRKWGYWLDGSGNALFPNNTFDAAVHDHGARKHALRILSENPVPPYPGAVSNPEGLGDTRPAFLPGRRTRLFTTNLTLAGVPIPPSQPAVPEGLTIEQIDYNPASGNTEEEFFVIKNAGTTAVDISGWKITGAVDYIFRGGTVIPAGGGANQNIGLLHVARNPRAFRQRATGPKGGEFRLVLGGYNGRLSARGGTIELRNASDVLVASSDIAASPTAAQNSLRVTELNFGPAAPTPEQSAALPGVKASDFEFLELLNTGDTALSLGGAQFDRGITFAFPAGFTLEPGARTVIVSQQAAFALRYGPGFNVAGQYEGNLDNAGEEVRLLDPTGEEVLRFTYDPTWFPPTVGGDYSLVTRSANPTFNGYDVATAFAISGQTGGTPGNADTSFAQVFEGWRHDHFTPSEQADVLVGSLTANPDGDAHANLGEYAFAKNPRLAGDPVTSSLSTVNSQGVDYVALSFSRPKQTLDLTYGVEISTDLQAWVPNGFVVGNAQDLGNGLERVTFAVTGLSQPHTLYHIRPVATRSDGKGSGDILTFTTPNTNPIATNKTLHAPPIGVLTAVFSTTDTSDPDGDARTLSVMNYAGSGLASSDGTQIHFTNGGFAGTETIQVGVSDGFGGSAAATVTLSNAPPVRTDKTIHAPPIGVLTAVFSTNDTDDPDGDARTLSVMSYTGSGAASSDGAQVTYTNAGFTGSETIQVGVADGVGGTAVATVTLSNAPPAGIADRFSSGTGSSVLDVLANDTDPDGDALIITAASASGGGTVLSDGAKLTYTPGDGFRGAEQLSYTVSDGRGGTANGNVTVIADFSVAKTLAATNGQVGDGTDAKWTVLGIPSIFAGGTKAGWLGSARGAAGKSSGIFVRGESATTFRLLSGDPARDATGASITGATFKSFKPPVFAGDGFAVIATITGPGIAGNENTGIWVGGQSTVREIGREGAAAPGASGGRFRAFTSLAMPAPETAFFTASLSPGSGVTKGTDTGLWVWNPTGTQLALREGQSLDLGNGASRSLSSFEVLSNVPGSPGHGRYDTSEQSVDVLLNFIDGSAAIASVDGNASIALTAVTGEADANGRTPTGFGAPSTPGEGEAPVAVTTFQAGGDFNSQNDAAVFDFGGNRIIAQEGAPAPGADGLAFDTFFDPVAGFGANGAKTTAFLATLRGAAKSVNVGLWADTVGAASPLDLVARAGAEPPGAPGTRFKQFRSVTVVEGRGPVFTAQLTSGTARVQSTNDQGVWATDSDGTLRLLLREGDLVNGKILRSFRLLELVPGSPGQRRSWTNGDPPATLIYLGTFNDSSSAVVTTTIP